MKRQNSKAKVNEDQRFKEVAGFLQLVLCDLMELEPFIKDRETEYHIVGECCHLLYKSLEILLNLEEEQSYDRMHILTYPSYSLN